MSERGSMYSEEFRDALLETVNAIDISLEQIAKENGIHVCTLRRWIKSKNEAIEQKVVFYWTDVFENMAIKETHHWGDDGCWHTRSYEPN